MSLTIDNLKKHKESLNASRARELSDFEKNFLLIVGGILAFTITFLKDMVGADQATNLLLLFSGWFFLSVAIGIIIISFLRSAKLTDTIWQYIDDRMSKADMTSIASTAEVGATLETEIRGEIKRQTSAAKKKLNGIRIAAIVSFFLGLVLVTAFVGVNFKNKRAMECSPKDVIELKIDKKNKIITLENLIINVKDSIIITKQP